jgi:polyferredoxin
MLPGAMFLAFIFVAYFVEPRDLWHRLAALDVSTAGGIAGAATTLLAFLDFAFLRLRFCTSACPYGYLQGFISDDRTLLVAYQDPGQECVECKKCLRVCPMDIDVRASAHQIQCIHCGECIDACQDVMVRVGKPGLVHYTWGNLSVRNAAPWYRGFVRMDAKRFLVMLVLLAYASALWVALAKRSAVLVRVAPDRATLYSLSPDGMVTNHFRVSVANRGREAAQVALRVEGLPEARLSLPANALTVAAGEAVTQEFDVSMYDAVPGVAKFQFVAAWTPKSGRREFPMTFIAPEKGSAR